MTQNEYSPKRSTRPQSPLAPTPTSPTLTRVHCTASISSACSLCMGLKVDEVPSKGVGVTASKCGKGFWVSGGMWNRLDGGM